MQMMAYSSNQDKCSRSDERSELDQGLKQYIIKGGGGGLLWDTRGDTCRKMYCTTVRFKCCQGQIPPSPPLPTQPKPTVPPRKYPCPPDISGLPFNQCGSLEDHINSGQANSNTFYLVAERSISMVVVLGMTIGEDHLYKLVYTLISLIPPYQGGGWLEGRIVLYHVLTLTFP